MTNTLLDPKNDFVFKKLFTDSPHLLADLINAVRNGEDPVEVIEIPNPRFDPAELSGKFIILDVLARDARGRLFNVEIQAHRLAAWIERSFYYAASAYVDQFKQGDDYATLKPVIGINLLDFDLFSGDQAHWHFRLLDGMQRDVALGHLQLHVLELRKLDRQRQASPGTLSDWVTWLKHWRDDAAMSTINHPPVHEAQARLKRLSRDEDTRWRARIREYALHDEGNFLVNARKKGMAEGLEKDLEQGREEYHAKLLARQLTLKFGDLPTEFEQRLSQAGEAELDIWMERILFAQTPAEIFG